MVKSLREHPDGFRTDPQQVLTEYAALEFLEGLGLDLAPRLLASDTAAGVLVLEDLAPRVPLPGILLHGDPSTAAAGLSAFAGAKGRLNAETVGHADAYYARRRTLGPVDPRIERERFMGWGWNETRSHTESLGVELSYLAENEMARVVGELTQPGAFLAFSNGDASSNNFLVKGGDGRFIDFEFAGYRHALTDAACLYVPGPIWITVSDPIATGLEAAYRDELTRAVPEANDDGLFGLGVAAACIAMAVERLHRFPRVDAREPEDPSRLQLVSTLESAAHAAEAHRALPHLRSWTCKVADALRRRWTDADVDLSSYPSYAPRDEEARRVYRESSEEVGRSRRSRESAN